MTRRAPPRPFKPACLHITLTKRPFHPLTSDSPHLFILAVGILICLGPAEQLRTSLLTSDDDENWDTFLSDI